MLPQIAQLGVGTLILCGAAKVDAHYFNSSVLVPETLRGHLAEGLACAGDTAVPRTAAVQELGALLQEGGELDRLVPRGEAVRLVAHPGGTNGSTELLNVPRPGGAGASRPWRVLLAVGPEAGWEEPEELALLEAAGFRCVTAGPRVLRSDVATSALLALAGELLLQWDAEGGGEAT
uniref:Ribosomal RNA small subunit methyltransferase E methyltransferase domain-containing protein n=1 Tax=Alexandrium catenella TaxID=2925 RepID=A0A7S1S4U9_ALECA|mmetsp:Transcript_86210/g.229136  ORF Transcript_86210/g.229136 Transcript_86210/m.229136 type:complete len:177 (+) Transcript_86210:3-533(+)